MQPKRGLIWHLGGVLRGFGGLAFRLALLFAVIGAGYETYILFGKSWFYVFIFAVLAARLHFELRLIERTEFPDDKPDRRKDDDGPDHPFRKR